MRVLLDANIFISFLLHPDADSPYATIVRAAVAGQYTLLAPAELLAEFGARVRTKPYLVRHIAPEDVDAFIEIVRAVAEALPTLDVPIPAVTRDPKDDYLLAYAVLARANYLVTGDKDLLVLGQVEGVSIVTPREFLHFLDPS